MTDLKDYQPSPYLIPQVELDFELEAGQTIVKSKLTIIPNPKSQEPDAPLKLHGEELELLAVAIDGMAVPKDQYTLSEEGLSLACYKNPITLEIIVAIHPDKNHQLEGLYASQSLLCTQCEAEGFRRITYFLDRPDVLSKWSVKLRADAKTYPHLLAGGDLISKQTLHDGRHEVLWVDPWPKPSYLFAIAAGDLYEIHDTYTTLSGREVDLFLYCEPHNKNRLSFAMESLKRAFAWDEKVYGREYDLSRFQIVAVDSFNMGAMENKGLNIFNASCLLAETSATTDDEFRRIEAIIAHEYFHNWTGNRITCRDWFQLTLKEGLTVYRDHSFTADHHSPQTVRLEQVQALIQRQFSEDAGAMAHPIQPITYKDINNFYTATVYEKGSEVIRMMHLLLGDRFRKGTDYYFEHHDGQAVTTEDWVSSLEKGSGVDLRAMRNWYSHYRTPRVTCKRSLDVKSASLTLTLEQEPTPNVLGESQPLCMPLQLAIWDPISHKKIHEALLVLKSWQDTWNFPGISNKSLISIGRGLSSPILLSDDHTLEERQALSLIDDDVVMRWINSRKNLHELYNRYLDAQTLQAETWVSFVESTLKDPHLDHHAKALLIKLPSAQEILEWTNSWDIDAAIAFYDHLQLAVAQKLRLFLLEQYLEHHLPDSPTCNKENSGHRYIKHAAIEYLLALHDPEIFQMLWKQLSHAKCMSDEAQALRMLSSRDNAYYDQAVAFYRERWSHDLLTWPRWFLSQSSSFSPKTLERCQVLLKDPLFDIKIPNQTRALIGGFAANTRAFHSYQKQDLGEGYRWLGECILTIDRFNVQVAARLAKSFAIYPRLTGARKIAMRSVCEKLLQESLSITTREVMQKCLEG